MAIVLWHTAMSLDGFVAGPGDAMDWVFQYNDPNPMVAEVIQTTGAVLAGRHTYDVGPRTGQPFYGGAWTGPAFVLTHYPPPPEQDPGVTFLSNGIRDAVATARSAANGKNVVLIGANLGQQCIGEGLVDELVIHLLPVLLGAGVRLYAGPQVNLQAPAVTQAGHTTNLRFRVRP
jgi:dihydrofolate reductase